MGEFKWCVTGFWYNNKNRWSIQHRTYLVSADSKDDAIRKLLKARPSLIGCTFDVFDYNDMCSII